MNLVTQIAIGFTVGGNVLMGQYFGKKDYENYKKASGTLFSFSLVLGIFSMILLFLLSGHILILLKAPALGDAVIYLKICALGMPFIFGYNAVSAALRALGNSKNPLYFIILSTSVNIALDIIFVAVLHMGTAGAALGTLTAQCVSFFAALCYGARHKVDLGLMRGYLKILPEKLKQIIHFGFPLALQMTVASISWLAVMVLINKYGVDVSAGNGVSNKIKDFCQLFITATTGAAATMAAQNLGAGENDRAGDVMKVCMKTAMLIAAGSIILAELFAPQLVSIFTHDPDVAVHAIQNLRIEIIAQIFYAVFMSYNILATGCGNTIFVMANSFLNCIVVRLVLAVILQHLLGITGVYIACMIAPASSMPVGFLYYKSGKWKTRKSVL